MLADTTQLINCHLIPINLPKELLKDLLTLLEGSITSNNLIQDVYALLVAGSFELVRFFGKETDKRNIFCSINSHTRQLMNNLRNPIDIFRAILKFSSKIGFIFIPLKVQFIKKQGNLLDHFMILKGSSLHQPLINPGISQKPLLISHGEVTPLPDFQELVVVVIGKGVYASVAVGVLLLDVHAVGEGVVC